MKMTLKWTKWFSNEKQRAFSCFDSQLKCQSQTYIEHRAYVCVCVFYKEWPDGGTAVVLQGFQGR